MDPVCRFVELCFVEREGEGRIRSRNRRPNARATIGFDFQNRSLLITSSFMTVKLAARLIREFFWDATRCNSSDILIGKFNSIVIIQASFNPFKSWNEWNVSQDYPVFYDLGFSWKGRGDDIIGVILSSPLIVANNSLNENLYIYFLNDIWKGRSF